MPSEDLTTRTAQEQTSAPPPLVIPEGYTLGPVVAQKLSMTQYYDGSFRARDSRSVRSEGGAVLASPRFNSPEVLGVAKAAWKPTRGANDRIDWRIMVPVSLNFDRRVINGADAARFMTSLAEILSRPEELGR